MYCIYHVLYSLFIQYISIITSLICQLSLFLVVYLAISCLLPFIFYLLILLFLGVIQVK